MKSRLLQWILASLAVVVGASMASVPKHQTALLHGQTIGEVKSVPLASQAALSRRPVVGIALGGGGLRGYAHIGVLQALEEAGIHPQVIVGTSVGAVVGVAYASGLTPDQIDRAATAKNVFELTDWTVDRRGLIKGDALASWVHELIGGVQLESLPNRFGAVATDLATSSAVLLSEGDAAQAVRASAAIPGVFLRVPYDKGELVDGGITSLVPVRFARALGADIVIGVDIYCSGERYEGMTIVSTLLQVTQAQSCLIAKSEEQEADVLVSPGIALGKANDAAARIAARKAGHDAMTAALPKLLKLTNERIGSSLR